MCNCFVSFIMLKIKKSLSIHHLIIGCLSIFITAIVIVPVISNKYITMTYDGMLHSAISNSIQYYGLPAQALYFHGHSLNYHWFVDGLIGLASQFFQSNILLHEVWPVYSLIFALTIQYSSYFLARKIGLQKIHSVITSFFILFGMNLLSSVIAALQYPYFVKNYGIPGMLDTHIVHDLHSWQFDQRLTILGKLYDPNSFPVALGFSIIAAYCLINLWESCREQSIKRILMNFSFYVFATFVLYLSNILSGLSFCALSIACFILLGIRNRNVIQFKYYALALTAPVITIIGLYYYQNTSIDTSSVKIIFPFSSNWNLTREMMGGLVLPSLLPIIFLLLSARHMRAGNKISDQHVILMTLICGYAVASFIVFPQDNQYKFIFHYYIFLTFISSCYFFRFLHPSGKIKRIILMAIMAVVFLNAIVFANIYAQSKPGGIHLHGDDTLGCAEWISRFTPKDSVFIEATSHRFSIPSALAKRPSYLGFINGLQLHGYPKDEIERRINNVQNVVKYNDFDLARSLGADYVLCDLTSRNYLRPGNNQRIVFENDHYTVFDVR